LSSNFLDNSFSIFRLLKPLFRAAVVWVFPPAGTAGRRQARQADGRQTHGTTWQVKKLLNYWTLVIVKKLFEKNFKKGIDNQENI